jgi:DNA-binding MarR family transcriptional regulator
MGCLVDASQVVVACRRVSAAIDSFDAAAAAKIGVNRNDLRALNLLEDGPLSQASIATALRITRSSVTTLVDRLEGAGFVRRMTDVHDRRSTLVELLPATWEAFARVYRPVGERVHRIAEGWDEHQRRVVIQALLQMAIVFDDATELDTKEARP